MVDNSFKGKTCYVAVMTCLKEKSSLEKVVAKEFKTSMKSIDAIMETSVFEDYSANDIKICGRKDCLKKGPAGWFYLYFAVGGFDRNKKEITLYPSGLSNYFLSSTVFHETIHLYHTLVSASKMPENTLEQLVWKLLLMEGFATWMEKQKNYPRIEGLPQKITSKSNLLAFVCTSLFNLYRIGQTIFDDIYDNNSMDGIKTVVFNPPKSPYNKDTPINAFIAKKLFNAGTIINRLVSLNNGTIDNLGKIERYILSNI